MSFINQTKLANRTNELQHFQEMLSVDATRRIFLLKAPSGYGKTDLLLKFSEHSHPAAYPVVVDIKAAGAGIPYVFWRIRDTLGDDNFPEFDKAVKDLTAANINIGDNKVIGQMDITIALEVDEQTQKFRLMQLQEAFFRDLRAIKQTIVFLFDTFNDPTTQLASWINDNFLVVIPKSPNLRVVIAGQSAPERNAAWENHCHRCELGEIKETEAWYKFTQEIGLNLEEKMVKLLIDANKGNPKNISELFQNLKSIEGYSK
ncbi:hypothetical protein [Calothrix sp. PCC 6303]|uniref:hypothetical protein n=1 Tax=Calothrix sp. PCC 6303 TaxID=1170562 RepID=UPI0002A04BBF|nr:hypothetical protein [Calothrix sp. PCC 6303]AFZ03643.1 hypothetical protein Cal6303_4744 [Calothrix sp. PCC 6303]